MRIATLLRGTQATAALAALATSGTAALAQSSTSPARQARATTAAPPVLPPHAHFPAPWVGLIGAADRAGGFDPTRLRVVAGTADVWIRYQYARDVPALGSTSPAVRAVEIREQVRCAERRMRSTGDVFAFNAHGDTVAFHVGTELEAWRPFGDGFHGDVLSRVCTCLDCAKRQR